MSSYSETPKTNRLFFWLNVGLLPLLLIIETIIKFFTNLVSRNGSSSFSDSAAGTMIMALMVTILVCIPLVPYLFLLKNRLVAMLLGIGMLVIDFGFFVHGEFIDQHSTAGLWILAPVIIGLPLVFAAYLGERIMAKLFHRNDVIY